MRRSSKGHGPRTTTQRQPTDTGTVKSIECQQGTGSIAPDRDAQVQADTGFTSDVVMDGDVTTLQVGDRVRFDAAPTPARPGYADATTVQADGGNIAGQAITPLSQAKMDTAPGRPPGAVGSAATPAVEHQGAALVSGQETPG
jgi:cold shock CspA family protein